MSNLYKPNLSNMAPIVKAIININDGIVSVMTCGYIEAEANRSSVSSRIARRMRQSSLRDRTRNILHVASQSVRAVNKEDEKKKSSR